MRTVEELRAIISARTGGQYAGAGTQAHEAGVVRRAVGDEAEVPRMADAAPVVTPVETRTQSRATETVSSPALERITALVGRPCAFDGRLCVWTTRDNDRTRDSYDVRDLAQRTGMTVDQILDALPDFTPVKRGRMGLQDAVEASE